VTAGTFQRNESGKFDALKSDSTQNLFLEMPVPSQDHYGFHSFLVVGLILSVYILMSFDFPFGRLFGVR
jgi:hypothetical protein